MIETTVTKELIMPEENYWKKIPEFHITCIANTLSRCLSDFSSAVNEVNLSWKKYQNQYWVSSAHNKISRPSVTSKVISLLHIQLHGIH